MEGEEHYRLLLASDPWSTRLAVSSYHREILLRSFLSVYHPPHQQEAEKLVPDHDLTVGDMREKSGEAVSPPPPCIIFTLENESK
jgi:hypothetical protein